MREITISKQLYDDIILALKETLERPFECTCEAYQERDTGAWIHDEEKCWLFMEDHIEIALKELEAAAEIVFPQVTVQQILDAGWNGFAVKLLAESVTMDPIPTQKMRFSYEYRRGRVGITIEPLPKTAVSEEVTQS